MLFTIRSKSALRLKVCYNHFEYFYLPIIHPQQNLIQFVKRTVREALLDKHLVLISNPGTISMPIKDRVHS